MQITILTSLLGACSMIVAMALPKPDSPGNIIPAPKVFIITMFPPEASIWYTKSPSNSSFGSLFANNITVPGFSPLFPQAHCTAESSVCLMTTGESEINAATSITSLWTSRLFDLRKTYFMIAGIAGVNPNHGTLADVAFAKYAVQVAMQYEFDARELPNDMWTGYIPQGSERPSQYPNSIYGTEVFEVNESLRDIAVDFAKTAKLNDSPLATAYRSQYNTATAARGSPYTKALRSPAITKCDTVTSDVFFSGALLGQAFENTTRLFTNGSGIYCMTNQEDNAILASLLRGATNQLLDFARVIIMRSGSNFDRPHPGISCMDNLFHVTQGGFIPSLENLFNAGNPVVRGILAQWETKFAAGITPKNYIGDMFGTLGGKPDFGPGYQTNDNPITDETAPNSVSVSAPLPSRATLKRSAPLHFKNRAPSSSPYSIWGKEMGGYGVTQIWKRDEAAGIVPAVQETNMGVGNGTIGEVTKVKVQGKSVVDNPIGKGKYGAFIAGEAHK
ncbi:purine nucleoside permease-domain-containing protein [Tricladium varicosporioides]|nr:purine nucleoside permease-domain-containing protein [Hymenoscyphus varicosporioides]